LALLRQGRPSLIQHVVVQALYWVLPFRCVVHHAVDLLAETLPKLQALAQSTAREELVAAFSPAG
jgi:hypothetical protein